MPYNVIIKEKEDHIRAEILGNWTRNKEIEDAIRVWSQVSEICHTKNINHILAIIKLSGHFPRMAVYKIAQSPEKFNWSRGFKLALVYFGEESIKSYLLMETVADNRGYTVRIFDNKHDAKEWLLES